jgi:hypothetical protein
MHSLDEHHTTKIVTVHTYICTNVHLYVFLVFLVQLRVESCHIK